MMLHLPGEPAAKVRCTAHRRFALVVRTGPDLTEATTLFRTDSPEAARKRGNREAQSWRRPVWVFDLRDGAPLGRYTGASFIQETTPCHECGQPSRYFIYGKRWCTAHRGLAERFRPVRSETGLPDAPGDH